MFPINALRLEVREITLRRPGVPRHFQIGFELGRLREVENRLMLLRLEAAPFPVMQLRPLPLGQNGPRQPAHAQREVVDAAQVLVRRNRPGLHDLHEMLRSRLDNRHVAEEGERLLREHALIIGLRRAMLGQSQGVHHLQPGPVGDLWIVRREIRAGDLHVHQRLSRGFVLRVAQSLGLAAVARAKLVCLPVRSS